MLKNFPVALPLQPEQQAIVNAIESALVVRDSAVQRALRENELIQEYRTRLFTDVITGKLDARTVAANLPEPAEPGPEPADGAEAELEGALEEVADAGP